eukprot:gene44853-54862_t
MRLHLFQVFLTWTVAFAAFLRQMGTDDLDGYEVSQIHLAQGKDPS